MKPRKTKASGEKNMWSGRFSESMSKEMKKLSFSLIYDQELYPEDIAGSLAHAEALYNCGILTYSELKKLRTGLKQIGKDLKKGINIFKPDDEDIHMAIERVLSERLGPLGKKLHTGRSRNDQVATDFRMYIHKKCIGLIGDILSLQSAVYEKSLEYSYDIIPGYTHLQQAQPVYISHYLMSFFWALERDKSRLSATIKNSNQLPLGSGALAGSAFKYDRIKVASILGFKGITQNSIDATAHRDYVLEFLNATAIIGSLLSRYAEDFVIWSSLEFGFISLSDAFSTGSSMMPQKKNPDSMELIRGKAGRLLGNYCSAFTAVKGAPLAYSRDLQEDKEPVFDSVKTLETCLKVMAGAIKSLSFNRENIINKLSKSILATDLADALAENGMPFRDAHKIVGEMVKKAEKQNCALDELPGHIWKNIPNGEKIRKNLNYTNSIQRRDIPGGTGKKSIANQLSRAKRILKSGLK